MSVLFLDHPESCRTVVWSRHSSLLHQEHSTACISGSEVWAMYWFWRWSWIWCDYEEPKWHARIFRAKLKIDLSLLEPSFYLNLTAPATCLQTTTALINNVKPCPFGRSSSTVLYCNAVSQISFVARLGWIPNPDSSKHVGLCRRRCMPAKAQLWAHSGQPGRPETLEYPNSLFFQKSRVSPWKMALVEGGFSSIVV